MTRFIIRRTLLIVPIVIGVTILVFLMFHLIPGDPAEYLMRGFGTRDQIEQLRESMGLNDPLPVQYWRFISGLARGDLGRALTTNRPVVDEVRYRFLHTIELAGVTLVFAVIIGVNLGIVSATKRHTIFDDISRLVALAGVSLPSFWLGLMLMYVFAYQLGWFPALGRGGYLWTLNGLRHIFLPALSLGAISAAVLARLTRSSMLDVLNEDYIRTARSKGLKERNVLYKHALRNALIPVVTVIGMQAGVLLGGAIVTETIFAWPGLGRLTLDGILKRDLPLIQGAVLIFAFTFVFLNFVVDLIYGYIDPRIRYD